MNYSDLKTTVICAMPCKVNKYTKYFRIVNIFFHGKYSLINKIKVRDVRIFMDDFRKYSMSHVEIMKQKYGDENYTFFVEYFLNKKK